ncbi:MAG TPA: MFS transporter [Methylomirabilota bacterium]|nr:MFS transporter [Methylomirabilota bacterium]
MTNRWAVLALIMAAQTMANVGPLGIPSIAPLIRESLGLSVTQAGSFLSAYYIGPVLMSLPAGWLADRWGVRGAMILGQALIAVGLGAVAVAPSFSFIVAILVVAGAGYGVLNPTTTKAGMAWFPPRQRATVVGLKQVGLPFGGALGALIMPPVALAFGWRAAVGCSAAAVGALAVLTWALYRDLPEPETKGPAPAPPRFWAVMANRDLWLVGVSTLIFAGVQTVFLAFLVLYLRDVVHIALVVAAKYLVAAQVSGAIGRIGFGLLSDRLFGGRRRIVLAIAGLGIDRLRPRPVGHRAGDGALAARAARGGHRVLRRRLERRAAHPHGRAGRAPRDRDRGGARPRHLLAGCRGVPAGVRAGGGAPGRLRRGMARAGRRHGARARTARPGARAGPGADLMTGRPQHA